jgi:hypothetical protein
MNKQRFPKHLKTSPKILGVRIEIFLVTFMASNFVVAISGAEGVWALLIITLAYLLGVISEHLIEPNLFRHKFRARKTSCFRRFKGEDNESL